MAQYVWTQRQDIGPSPRQSHAMAYDAARRRTLLFGGLNPAGMALLDTWAWDGEFWTQVADTGPSGRFAAAMAYDTARNRIVLFGGALTNDHGDTWEWDGDAWRQVADMGPSPRSAAAMAFDPSSARMVLFGGRSGPTVHDDTWTWDGGHWTQVADTGPSARAGHAMAHARQSGRTLLVGGHDASGVALAGTWAFNGQGWTQIDDMGPPALTWASVVDTGDGVFLFGGAAAGGTAIASRPAFDSTWRFAGGSWTQVQDMGPPARSRAGSAFDENRGAVVLFGGSPDGPEHDAPPQPITALGETWELPVAAGSPAPARPPPPFMGDLPVVVLTPTVLASPVGSEILVGFASPGGAPPAVAPVSVEVLRAPDLAQVDQQLINVRVDNNQLKIARVGPAGPSAGYVLRILFSDGRSSDTPFTG